MRLGKSARVAALAVAVLLGDAAARADWTAGIGTFRIGLVAEPGAGGRVAGLSALRAAYGRALGMPVEFLVADGQAALVEAQAAGRVHYAVLSATAFAAARLRCGCVEPLAAPTGADGSVGVRAVLLARDGRLAGAGDLAGHRVAVQPPDSVTGWQLPAAALGLSPGAAGLVAAGSAEQAETWLAEGTVDAMFGWEPAEAPGAPPIVGGTAARLAAAGLPAGRLAVVWRSGVLRYGPHAVRADLDPEAKRRLIAFLLALKTFDPDTLDLIEPQRQGGFAPAAADDYRVATELVEAMAAAGP